MSAKTLKRLLLLPWRVSLGSQLSDEKVVVSVFLVLLAGCIAGFFFVGGAILDMKDEITEVNEALIEVRRNIADIRQDIAEMQHDIAEMRQDIAGMRGALHGFGAEVSER